MSRPAAHLRERCACLAVIAALALAAAPPARAQDPAVVGEWGPLIEGFPVVAVHSILLHTGKILFMRGDGEDEGGVGVYRTHLLDPATNQFETMDPGANVFCSGHSFLPDGRVLVSGGELEENLGPVHLHIFDPVT
jgi:galactose oxidase